MAHPVTAEMGYPDFMRSNQSVVFGHEFCGEVLDHGPKTRKAVKPGNAVVAVPLVAGTVGLDGVENAFGARRPRGAREDPHRSEERRHQPVPLD
jgi:Alcohol dehydrogenase GroES-like domain